MVAKEYLSEKLAEFFVVLISFYWVCDDLATSISSPSVCDQPCRENSEPEKKGGEAFSH